MASVMKMDLLNDGECGGVLIAVFPFITLLDPGCNFRTGPASKIEDQGSFQMFRRDVLIPRSTFFGETFLFVLFLISLHFV